MLRSTALTALTVMLMLSADAATTALSPLGAPTLTAEAHGADFSKTSWTGMWPAWKLCRGRAGVEASTSFSGHPQPSRQRLEKL